MKAVILAGGKGTRLTPYTKVLPKPLMPIGDMPILEILLRQLKRANFNEVVLTVGHMAHLLEYHCRSKAIATIATHTRQVRVDLGVIQFDGDQCVVGYQEKPTFNLQVSMGIYVFEPEVLRYIPHNQYLDFPDLVLKLVAAGERVMGYPFSGYWQDLGRPDDYEQAVQDFEGLREQILGMG
ncbi:MAG: sugar phosphate nucleotidyltransferase [Anaerolineales bacterium]|nr:sugar phosphate nucleotidyltransferase [Anaerolineales bacterium]